MGDVSYRPLIDDMVFSYSRLECFNDCPYRWFLKYISGIAEEPTFYSTYGKLMHSLLERFYLGLLNREDMPAAFLTEFSDAVRGERPSGQIVSNYIGSGLDYLRSFKPLPFRTLAVEKRFRFFIGDVPFVGVVDFIGERDGDIYVVDHKSRNLKPRSGRKKPTASDAELDAMLRQLYLYAAYVESEYGRRPKALCFNCFRSNELITEPFDPVAQAEAVSWALKTIEDIRSCEDFHPNIEYFQCRWLCGMRGDCIFHER